MDSHSQEPTLPILPSTLGTTTDLSQDSIPTLDSIPALRVEADLGEPNIKDTFTIRTKDGVDREVVYEARDSSSLNRKQDKLYLWGEAKITYDSYVIEADIIILDIKENIAYAKSIKGEEFAGFVLFNDGTQEMRADELKYNFKSKKGHLKESRTSQGDLYIVSEQMKFISAEDDEYRDDAGYGKDAIFTTCNAPTPHFGVRSRKQKIVPNKVVVVGPSNIEIGQVPTPLVLPFGFYPIVQGASKGIIFPNDYEYSEAWGFGLRGIGYYIPINEKFDMTVTGDIYLRGSWGVDVGGRYNFRYKSTGNYNVAYSRRVSENTNTGIWVPEVTTRIRWSHNQDPKAHPYRNLNGSIDFQTGGFQNLNFNDARSVLQNSITSNVSYRQTFAGKPYNLAASLQHSQNTRNNQVIINFPVLDFQMQRLFPFARKNRGGNKPRWYEEISLTYNSRLSNRFTTTDTTVWSRQTLDDARFGIQHRAAVNSNFRLLRYISVVPSVNLNEVWQFSSVRYNFNPNLIISDPRDTIFNSETGDFILVRDTIFGRVDTTRVSGFQPWRTYSIGASMNTQIFGTLQFRKGFIRGVRHVVKPSVNFNYSPDYTNPNLGYFREFIRDANNLTPQFYNIFEDAIFGGPPRTGRQMAINYSINNIFEAKYWSRRDSMAQKVKLFDNIIINGNYNFAADSLKFSPITFSGTHRMFKGMTTVQMNMTMDPYERDYTRSIQGTRINVYSWDANRRILNFVNATANINTSLSMRQIRQWFTGGGSEGQNSGNRPPPDPQGLGPQSLWDWFEEFNINHILMLGYAKTAQGTTFMIGTNNIQFTGNIVLTKNWRVTLGSIGYDFNRKQMTYPDVGFQRDLHCWEMGMNWQPLRGTYNFYIRVKPGSLDFLSVPYRKNNQDGLDRRF